MLPSPLVRFAIKSRLLVAIIIDLCYNNCIGTIYGGNVMTYDDLNEALLQELHILEDITKTKDLTFTERCAYVKVLALIHLAECQGSRILSEPLQES